MPRIIKENAVAPIGGEWLEYVGMFLVLETPMVLGVRWYTGQPVWAWSVNGERDLVANFPKCHQSNRLVGIWQDVCAELRAGWTWHEATQRVGFVGGSI